MHPGETNPNVNDPEVGHTQKSEGGGGGIYSARR
jgi:hypothetical protein